MQLIYLLKNLFHLKKWIVLILYFSIIFWSLSLDARELTISCPDFYNSKENVLIGVNIFNAKFKEDKEKYVLAPDKQILNKHTYLYTQYWHPSQDSPNVLKKFVECRYLNISSNNIIYLIPNLSVCKLDFINKPINKGLITKNTHTNFYCYTENAGKN